MLSTAGKHLIVTAANDKYFDLLSGMIASIKRHQPGEGYPIGILDVGLTESQKSELASRGMLLAEAQWDFDFPARAAAPRWFQAMTTRCNLPSYFPGYEMYIWLDCDAWLQDWRAIGLLSSAASDGALAIVPEIHPAYVGMYDRGNLQVHDNRKLHSLYADAYGKRIADRMILLPAVNTGAFALRGDSQSWGIWRQWLEQGLAQGGHKIVEQNALNAAVYTGQIPYKFLPSWCNWICGQALPRFDVKHALFVEPTPPYEPVSIVHVTPRNCAFRNIETLDGQVLALPLDYLAFQARV
jgi:hypothetical protein